MMSNKFIAVIIMALGLSSVTMAREEKFEENYKVEGAVKTERQIASEKESEREPSSVVAPPPAEIKPDEEAPQPWLHKAETSPRKY